MSGPNTKYEAGRKHIPQTSGRVIKNGHTMRMADVIKDLRRLTYLERRVLLLEDRERKCATMDDAEKVALVRALQEVCEALMLDRNKTSPAQIVENVEGISKIMHYPDCWDTMAYPTLLDAIKESAYPCTSCDQTGNCDKEKNG